MIDYAGIIRTNSHSLDGGLTDDKLSTFFQSCFQDSVEQGGLWPSWVCMECKHLEIGEKPSECTLCQSDNVFSIATFQGRASVFGRIFEMAVRHVLQKYYSNLGIKDSDGSDFDDHCDLLIPEVAGIEIKGSAAHITLPNGAQITFPRPGMKRSDTEKKANSNADTFKNDYLISGVPDARFYVLTNALPKGWQEAGSKIDGIFDVTRVADWEDFKADIENDVRRASRNQRGRR